jgi:hypothetical protein
MNVLTFLVYDNSLGGEEHKSVLTAWTLEVLFSILNVCHLASFTRPLTFPFYKPGAQTCFTALLQ